VNAGHILIARPDKAGAAQARLKQMGIDAMTLPAITLPPLSAGLAQAGYARFAGGMIERTPAQQGTALTHLGALQMGRALKWEWVGLWEEDVCGAGAVSNGEGFSDGPGFQTLPLSRARGLRVGDFWDAFEIPPDCGAVYLGGALWGSADCYGEDLGGGLWRARALPISCTHALMIHAQAMDDVIASCARMDMTIDDCVSRACMEATTQGKWSTCFVQPWIAWQLDRRETWPRELIEEVEREK
jgi:hypothetical protein